MVVKMLLLMSFVAVASGQSTISSGNAEEYERGLFEDIQSFMESTREALMGLQQAAVRSETQAMQLKLEMEEFRQVVARQHYWSRSECPPGFEYLQDADSCYKVIFERMTWDDATDKCRRIMPGVHLAAITSQKENDAIARYLETQFRGNNGCTQQAGDNWPEARNLIWISGHAKHLHHRCGDPYVWRPLNGIELPFNYSNWNLDRNYPDCFSDAEKCAQIMTGYNYTWNDYDCTWKICAICEIHV